MVAEDGDLGAAVLCITHFTVDFSNNFFSIHLEEKVEAGRRLRVTVPYVAFLSVHAAGFFVVTYSDEGVER